MIWSFACFPTCLLLLYFCFRIGDGALIDLTAMGWEFIQDPADDTWDYQLSTNQSDHVDFPGVRSSHAMCLIPGTTEAVIWIWDRDGDAGNGKGEWTSLGNNSAFGNRQGHAMVGLAHPTLGGVCVLWGGNDLTPTFFQDTQIFANRTSGWLSMGAETYYNDAGEPVGRWKFAMWPKKDNTGIWVWGGELSGSVYTGDPLCGSEIIGPSLTVDWNCQLTSGSKPTNRTKMFSWVDYAGVFREDLYLYGGYSLAGERGELFRISPTEEGRFLWDRCWSETVSPSYSAPFSPGVRQEGVSLQLPQGQGGLFGGMQNGAGDMYGSVFFWNRDHWNYYEFSSEDRIPSVALDYVLPDITPGYRIGSAGFVLDGSMYIFGGTSTGGDHLDLWTGHLASAVSVTDRLDSLDGGIRWPPLYAGRDIFQIDEVLDTVANQTWGILDALSGFATENWVSGTALAPYETFGNTQDWVSGTALDGYATEVWVNETGLFGFATEDWVSTTALGPYETYNVTRSWVAGTALSGYATQVWVTDTALMEYASLNDTQSWVTNTALADYETFVGTQSWVTGTALADYATFESTKAWVNFTALADYETFVLTQGWVTGTALADYETFDGTKSWVNLTALADYETFDRTKSWVNLTALADYETFLLTQNWVTETALADYETFDRTKSWVNLTALADYETFDRTKSWVTGTALADYETFNSTKSLVNLTALATFDSMKSWVILTALADYETFDSTKSWVNLTLADYETFDRTKSWVNSTALANYETFDRTKSWVNLTALADYETFDRTKSWVNLTALADYETFLLTQNWVTGTALADYADFTLTQNWVTSTALANYETLANTQSWVTTTALSGFATETWVTTALAEYEPFNLTQVWVMSEVAELQAENEKLRTDLDALQQTLLQLSARLDQVQSVAENSAPNAIGTAGLSVSVSAVVILVIVTVAVFVGVIVLCVLLRKPKAPYLEKGFSGLVDVELPDLHTSPLAAESSRRQEQEDLASKKAARSWADLRDAIACQRTDRETSGGVVTTLSLSLDPRAKHGSTTRRRRPSLSNADLDAYIDHHVGHDEEVAEVEIELDDSIVLLEENGDSHSGVADITDVAKTAELDDREKRIREEEERIEKKKKKLVSHIQKQFIRDERERMEALEETISGFRELEDVLSESLEDTANLKAMVKRRDVTIEKYEDFARQLKTSGVVSDELGSLDEEIRKGIIKADIDLGRRPPTEGEGS